MRRPTWVLALLFALAVAAGFAWLGQWQLSHAVQEDTEQRIDTETPHPLAELNTPGEPVTDAAAGRVVTVEGAFDPVGFMVVEQRVNADAEGAWVVGHLVSRDGDEPVHLAVALGWAPSTAEAEAARDELASSEDLRGARELSGRYMPAEGVQPPDPGEDPFVLRNMAPAQLANLWEGVETPVYSGFLVLHGAESGVDLAAFELDPIDSVPPLPQDRINWLNLFYAVEWVVFAGFAVYFWFRLTRDAWEKEHELQELEASAERETPPSPDA